MITSRSCKPRPKADATTQLSAKSLILTCSLLALTPAYGADELSCETSLGRALAVDSPLREIVLDNPDTIQLEAGEFEAQLGPSPTARMSGGVLLRRDDKIAGADSAYYDPDQRALFLQGGVLYEDRHTQIQSRSAEFGYELGRIRFEGAEFSLGESNSRGAAEDLEINQDGTLSLGTSSTRPARPIPRTGCYRASLSCLTRAKGSAPPKA